MPRIILKLHELVDELEVHAGDQVYIYRAPFPISGAELADGRYVNVSVGITSFPKEPKDPESLAEKSPILNKE